MIKDAKKSQSVAVITYFDSVIQSAFALNYNYSQEMGPLVYLESQCFPAKDLPKVKTLRSDAGNAPARAKPLRHRKPKAVATGAEGGLLE